MRLKACPTGIKGMCLPVSMASSVSTGIKDVCYHFLSARLTIMMILLCWSPGKLYLLKYNWTSWVVLVHAFNPSTREAEAGESVWVWGQPGLLQLAPGQAPKLQRIPVSKKNWNATTEKTRDGNDNSHAGGRKQCHSCLLLEHQNSCPSFSEASKTEGAGFLIKCQRIVQAFHVDTE